MRHLRDESLEVDPEVLVGTDGSVLVYRGYLPSELADDLFFRLVSELDWSQESAKLFGKEIPLPRLTAWYGERPYAYSGVLHPARALPPVLASIMSMVEPVAPHVNCVLGNYYRDQSDSVSWHSDNDPEAGGHPLVCSVSFGETRRFIFRHIHEGLRVDTELRHGDVLVMEGETQRHWQHKIPKSKLALGPRVNLTFRRFTKASAEFT